MDAHSDNRRGAESMSTDRPGSAKIISWKTVTCHDYQCLFSLSSREKPNFLEVTQLMGVEFDERSRDERVEWVSCTRHRIECWWLELTD